MFSSQTQGDLLISWSKKNCCQLLIIYELNQLETDENIFVIMHLFFPF